MQLRCPQCDALYPATRPLICSPADSGFEGIFDCGDCGLISLQPYPAPEVVASWYENVGSGELVASGEWARIAKRRIEWIEELTGGRPGRVLEIGAGRGDFVLEHCLHPAEILEALLSHLQPGGVLLLKNVVGVRSVGALCANMTETIASRELSVVCSGQREFL